MSRPQPIKLTAPQRQVLNALVTHIEDQGVSPTWNELMARLDIVSRARVQTIIKQLINHGYIEKDERVSSRNLIPLLDPMGRPLKRPDHVHIPDRPSAFADQADVLLRTAVHVLERAAIQIDDEYERVPVQRLAKAITLALAMYRDG